MRSSEPALSVSLEMEEESLCGGLSIRLSEATDLKKEISGQGQWGG